MMWRSPEPRYDVATGLAQGGRDYQEDAIVSDFSFGLDSGIAVLADGMGGHEAGDVASKLVVTEVYNELKFASATFAETEENIPGLLRRATDEANHSVAEYVQRNPAATGMGATLVSLVLVENRMYWVSVGDSPLYLLRDGQLRQLNDDHSLAPQIDFMVEQGLMDPDVAEVHPDRNCLTSVIMGSSIPKCDCPMKSFELQLNDVVIVSSDGLQNLGDAKLEKVLHRYRKRKSAELAGHLLQAIEAHGDPDQDNVSFSVIKLNHMKAVDRKVVSKPIGDVMADADNATRVIAMPDPEEMRARGNREDEAENEGVFESKRAVGER
ncbi:MAG: protein phosphatase 2C domain-containing protein [Pseudomonadota bacterium]